MSYAMEHPIAVRAAETARAAFIRRTYAHLAGAILAFVALELVIFQVLFPTQEAASELALRLFGSPVAMLVMLALFIGVGWLADAWARSEASPALQYLGLAVTVVLWAVIFIPILTVATYYVKDAHGQPDRSLIPTAGILTLGMFAGLTLSVFVTRKDFSFLRPILCVASLIAIALCIAAIIFGFTLGLLFSFAMVALASGFILYDTSNVLHHYRTDQHVAAALALFASVAMLFFYILRILIQVAGNRQ
jgi:FtsH-binding integral membrane protein